MQNRRLFKYIILSLDIRLNTASGVQGSGTWTHNIGGQPWKSFLPSYPSCYSATGAGHRSVVAVPVMAQDVDHIIQKWETVLIIITFNSVYMTWTVTWKSGAHRGLRWISINRIAIQVWAVEVEDTDRVKLAALWSPTWMASSGCKCLIFVYVRVFHAFRPALCNMRPV